MRYALFAATAAVLASAVAGCASESTYSRDYAYRSGYTPTGYYYANNAYPARAPGYYANGVYYPPSTAYPNPAPYSTSDNYYSSRGDYYRNYQGIHGGPERTDGVRY
jgi:hypothetical protein